MNDDADLTRFFAQADELPADEAFVARVAGRIARRRLMAWALPAGVAALLLLAIWATWPAAYEFSSNAYAGIDWLTDAVRGVAMSDAGMLAITALVLTAASWSWLYDFVRGAQR